MNTTYKQVDVRVLRYQAQDQAFQAFLSKCAKLAFYAFLLALNYIVFSAYAVWLWITADWIDTAISHLVLTVQAIVATIIISQLYSLKQTLKGAKS